MTVITPRPLPGDFRCLPVRGWVGAGIYFGQLLNGDRLDGYEHADIYIGEPDRSGPLGYTVSAYPDGNGRRPLHTGAFDDPAVIWSTGIVDLTDAQRVGITDWCKRHEHVQYSSLDYFALTAHRLRIPAPHLREFIAQTDRMICSQFVDAAYETNGVKLFTDDRWTGYVTPGDLADLLQARHLLHLAT